MAIVKNSKYYKAVTEITPHGNARSTESRVLAISKERQTLD